MTVNARFEESIRISYSRTEIVDCVQDIEHPIVREALKLLNLGPHMEILSMADLPSNTGLGRLHRGRHPGPGGPPGGPQAPWHVRGLD